MLALQAGRGDESNEYEEEEEVAGEDAAGDVAERHAGQREGDRPDGGLVCQHGCEQQRAEGGGEDFAIGRACGDGEEHEGVGEVDARRQQRCRW